MPVRTAPAPTRRRSTRARRPAVAGSYGRSIGLCLALVGCTAGGVGDRDVSLPRDATDPAGACRALRDALAALDARCGEARSAAEVEAAITEDHGCDGVVALTDPASLAACRDVLDELSCERLTEAGTPAVCRAQLRLPCDPLRVAFPEDGAALERLRTLPDGQRALRVRLATCGIAEGTAIDVTLERSDGVTWQRTGTVRDGEVAVDVATIEGPLVVRATWDDAVVESRAVVLPACTDTPWLRLVRPARGAHPAGSTDVALRRCRVEGPVRVVAIGEGGEETIEATTDGSRAEVELAPGPVWLRVEGGGVRSPQIELTMQRGDDHG
ncbi:MAG TPA: hypothetical protein RMH99_27700 [Sandaracinaceae bacterium LLY-WYZ-13_1]|nr:hypothetical protein [Sandaracinaceae bacterium LLY-WYZ-13_1]